MEIRRTPGENWRNWSALPILVLVVVAFLFNWFYLTGGFQCDDIIFLNMYREDPLPFERWRSPWSIDEHPCFERLWWVDASSFQGAFWRPVPGLVLEGSLRLFGEKPLPLHLLSLLLHAGVTVTLYLLVHRLVKKRGLAFLAALFFVACEDHSMSVGWISTVTDLLCVQAVLLSLLAWLEWLKERKLLFLVLSLLAAAAALGCKESAAAGPVALALLGILLPDGKPVALDRERLRFCFHRVWRGAGGWLPPLLLLCAYLAAYRLIGLGGMQSLIYIDPFSDPARFMSHMVLHMPVMWLATLSLLPPSLVLFEPDLLVWCALSGAVLAAGLLLALFPFRKDPLVIWAASLYFCALVPQMGTDASERLLYFPTVFGSILLAWTAARVAPLALRFFIAAPAAPLFTRLMGWWMMAAVLLPGVILSAAMPFYYLPSLEQPTRDLSSLVPHLGERDQAVILLNGPNPFITLYTNDVVTWLRNRPTEIWLLAAPSARMSLTRLDGDSFELRSDRRGWLSNLFARLVRSESALAKGAVYDRKLFAATLLELTSDSTDVLAVRFDMKQPLDDPAVAFFHWDGRGYVPMNVSELVVGQVKELADTSDLWASM